METAEQDGVNQSVDLQVDASPIPSRHKNEKTSDESTSVAEPNENKAENLSDESSSGAQPKENKVGASSERSAAEPNEGYRFVLIL